MSAIGIQRRSVALVVAATLTALLTVFAAGAALAGRFEGVASCAGSTCHGRAEGNGAVVRQDELRLWQEPSSRAGAHSRTFAGLVSPRGQRIASTLGLGSAGSAAACLSVFPASVHAAWSKPPGKIRGGSIGDDA